MTWVEINYDAYKLHGLLGYRFVLVFNAFISKHSNLRLLYLYTNNKHLNSCIIVGVGLFEM